MSKIMKKINSVCDCHSLLPQICTVIGISDETTDIKTFRIQTMEGKRPFDPLPGQFGMFSLPGRGQAAFSITAQGENWIETAIRRVGAFTEALHEMEIGQQLGVKGPYGNTFPLDHARGKDLLFVSGGIGLAPLRSFINYILQNRTAYGKIDILHGAKSYDDLAFKTDLFEIWPGVEDVKVHLTLDQTSPDWHGMVGFVPDRLAELAIKSDNRVAIVCGPPVMIGLCLERLKKNGFTDDVVFTTLEMRMQCGIGKCGHCNIGSKLVCLDGPVFSSQQLSELYHE